MRVVASSGTRCWCGARWGQMTPDRAASSSCTCTTAAEQSGSWEKPRWGPWWNTCSHLWLDKVQWKRSLTSFSSESHKRFGGKKTSFLKFWSFRSGFFNTFTPLIVLFPVSCQQWNILSSYHALKVLLVFLPPVHTCSFVFLSDAQIWVETDLFCWWGGGHFQRFPSRLNLSSCHLQIHLSESTPQPRYVWGCRRCVCVFMNNWGLDHLKHEIQQLLAPVWSLQPIALCFQYIGL